MKMVKVIVVARESGKLDPDYSLPFDLPAIPRPGDYLSIQRPDDIGASGEDFVVAKVWWRLAHMSTSPETAGTCEEIFVECQPALGPYSSKRWRASADAAAKRGFPFAELEVSRMYSTTA